MLYSSFTQGAGTKLYGATKSGGINNRGVIFEYDFVADTVIKKIDFSLADGSNPDGSLVAANGYMYLAATQGGINGYGTILEYDYINNVCIKKAELNDTIGWTAMAALTYASNGKFYGTTNQGCNNTSGCLYEYDNILNTVTLKAEFLSAEAKWGGTSKLFNAGNGKLYGTARGGGLHNYGVIFEYDIATNTYHKEFDFVDSLGANPRGSFYEYTPGKLLGVTTYGGANNEGVLYEYDYLNNIYTKRFDFIDSLGSEPADVPVLFTNGNLYGVTTYGGTNIHGVIYEYNYNTNTYTKKRDLIPGSTPYAGMALAPNGKLYGTTYGGNFGGGYIYSYNPLNNAYTTLLNFNQSSMLPVNSVSPLVLAPNGLFYSTLTTNGNSKMYAFNYLTQSISTVYTFTSVYSAGNLLLATNNKFYGSIFNNASSGIFEFDYTNNAYLSKASLTPLTGYGNNYLTEVNLTGLANEVDKKSAFELNPNPGKGIYNLQFDSPLLSDVRVEIVNTLGEVLHEQKILRTTNNCTINISNYVDGVYFLKVYGKDEVDTKRFIKL